MFKLVKTVENGKVYITAVPEKWEENGNLWWPDDDSVVQKLRRKGNSIPNVNWMKTPCSVKKYEITTFKEALDMEKQYCELTDTDSGELPNIMRKKRHRHHPVDVNVQSYNAYIENLRNENTSSTTVAEENIVENNNPCDFVQSLEVENNNSDDIEAVHPTQILLTADESTMSQIDNRLKTLEEKIASVSAKHDRCLQILEKIAEKLLISDEAIQSSADVDEKINFPLSTIQELDTFEKDLTDRDFRNKMVKRFATVGGTNGKENGRLVAYKLIDVLIKRDVLKNYTWTGISRDNSKKSFSALKNLNALFIYLVTLADNRYSSIENEFFFKNGVLKHSSIRAEQRTNQRQSTPRTSFAKKKIIPTVNISSDIDLSIQTDVTGSTPDEQKKQ